MVGQGVLPPLCTGELRAHGSAPRLHCAVRQRISREPTHPLNYRMFAATFASPRETRVSSGPFSGTRSKSDVGLLFTRFQTLGERREADPGRPAVWPSWNLPSSWGNIGRHETTVLRKKRRRESSAGPRAAGRPATCKERAAGRAGAGHGRGGVRESRTSTVPGGE